MIACQDWRWCDGKEIGPLLAAEVRAWRRELDWDVAEAWRVVEPARQAGTLAGFVAREAHGAIAGWTSFLVHRGCLQVLAFVASAPDAASALLTAIQRSADAAGATSSIVCVRAASPRLSAVLRQRGFEVEPYRYLQRGLPSTDPVPAGVRPWTSHDAAMARLCARAYADVAGVRAFAPNGTMDEWTEYVGNLLRSPGCGWFARDLSFVVPGEGPDELAAAVLVTDLSPGTAHIAQIVVDPSRRGRGWGRRLMTAAAAAAGARGYTQMTLLVAASNRLAVPMYEQLGFVDRARFVVATRRQPIVSTSAAWASGGDSTRL